MTAFLVKPLNIVFILAIVLAAITGLATIPWDQSLPIHWGINGEPDAFAAAPIALALPLLIAAAVLAILAVVQRKNPADFERGQHITSVAVTFVLGLILLIELIVLVTGLGWAIEVPRLVTLAVGLLFIALGNSLPKSQPNAVAGVRLPWTLGDASNWRTTNLWAGRLMMFAGLVMALAALATNESAVLVAVIALGILVPLIASTAISYVLAKRA